MLARKKADASTILDKDEILQAYLRQLGEDGER
jgi:hypothetical protein